MNLVIEGGVVVDAERVIWDGAVVVEDNRIVFVGDAGEAKRRFSSAGYDRVDARGKIIAPGLVNAHTHIAMTLLRGYADDLALQEWLEKWIWPFESRMSPRDIELGALLGSIESLLGGVTTVCSMYHYDPEHNEASAAARAGLRIVMGVAMFYWDEEGSVSRVRDALSRWHARDDLVRVSISPHAPYTVSPDMWRVAEELRREWSARSGVPVTITSHLVEDWDEPRLVRERFGVDIPDGSIYKYLDGLGVLSRYFVAAHSIHMNDVDFEVASERGVNIVHNPVANLKLGMGIADVPRMLRSGINVGLGTDGPASNNTLDMFETMKVTALLHKGSYRDPSLLPAKKVFEMATVDGARALGYNDLGLLREGYLADIIVIDYRKPSSMPLFNIYSHLVYVFRPGNIDMVIVNGEVLVEDGKYSKMDVDELVDRASRRAHELAGEVSGGA